MKNVIIVDASPIFREFLKDKLNAEKVAVTIATGRRDAFIKMLSNLPDLIILDVQDTFEDLLDFLKKKYADPNAMHIPIIIAGPLVEHSKLSVLAQFGVIKYFPKPLKFDIFFESVGSVLKLAFSMDVTPCILDIHKNGNILFIELAQGLNREKLSLLKYKLSEMIEDSDIETPKIVLMITNLELSFIDAPNLEFLLDNILAVPKVQAKNITVLSLDNFTRELISGHDDYTGIEISTDISNVLNTLVESTNSVSISEVITDKILSQTDAHQTGSIETRFYTDNTVIKEERNSGDLLKVALIDDDIVILKILEKAFKDIGATCSLFTQGTEFLNESNKQRFDLAILDIFMPGISGFDILKRLKDTNQELPVIIYSQVIQREAVVQALSLGAKRYLLKPQKAEVIIQKAKELLNGKI